MGRVSVVTNPLVSILVPNYNKGPFLGHCLWLCFCQAYRPVEVVLSENGSTDQSGLQYLCLAGVPNLVHVYSSTKIGIAAALNAAFKVSKGEFIAVVASDDLKKPFAVERLMKVMDENPDVDIVWGDLGAMNRRGHVVKMTNCSMAFSKLYLMCGMSISSALIRRRAFDKIGLFDGRMQTSEDWEWLIRAKKAGLKFKYLGGDAGHRWRDVAGSGPHANKSYVLRKSGRRVIDHLYIRRKHKLKGPCQCGCQAVA